MSRTIAQGLLGMLTEVVDGLARANGQEPLEHPSIDDPEGMRTYAHQMMEMAQTTAPSLDAIPFVDASNMVDRCDVEAGEN
jgi:hypothetical protein